MTNLIQNLPRNNPMPNLYATPYHSINNQYARQVQPSLSPEAKSTLWSGLMCGVLGGIWGAPPKYNADDLINLKEDSFVKITKGAQNAEPEAFSAFSEIKKNINETLENNLKYFFNDEEEISKQSLLKKLNETSEETLANSLEKMRPSIEKINSIDLDSLFAQTSDFNKLSKEQLEALKTTLGEKLFAEIETQKPDNIKNFLTNKIKLYERKNFGLLLCNTSTNGQIFKTHAKEFANNKLLETYAEKIKEVYNKISSKLPKKRFKTAAKWFGMGLGFSMLMNALFSTIRSKKSKK